MINTPYQYAKRTVCVQHICTNIEGSLKDKWIQGRKRAKCTPLNLFRNLCTCTHICFYAGVALYNLYPPRSTFSRRLQSRGIKWALDHVWALWNPVTIILKLVFGIISSTFKSSLDHTSCEQLWGILLAASQTENYTSQINHTRDWDEE